MFNNSYIYIYIYVELQGGTVQCQGETADSFGHLRPKCRRWPKVTEMIVVVYPSNTFNLLRKSCFT